MNDWIIAGNPPPDNGMHTEYRTVHRHRNLIEIKTVTDDGYANSVCLADWELLAIAISLPEVKALIKWALNVRETMSEEDLFVHGEWPLKPFIGKETE